MNPKSRVKIFTVAVGSNVLAIDDLLYDFLTNDRKLIISKDEVTKLKVHKLKGKLEVEVPLSILKRKIEPQISFELKNDDILYEDDGLIVVCKPNGLPTQATLDPRRDHLYASVERYLKKKCYLHHRLDVETSGLVLFVKKKELNKSVGEMFEKKKIRKHYLAVVRPPPKEKSFVVENYLAKLKQKILKMHSVKSGGDKAITEFEVLQKDNIVALVKASPITGRTHQIRVHLSERGYPIIGDKLYGDESSTEPRMYLHAYKLEFIHPEKNIPVTIKTPIPKDFLLNDEKLDIS